jgi:5-hydroxyisourate hydrolase
MSTLSTHVLDDARHAGGGFGHHADRAGWSGGAGVTNEDGRAPGLAPADLAPGRYRLTFAVAAYFRGKGVDLPEPPFLDDVAIDFGISQGGGHYHVPLLVSPFSYSTYRGS